MPGSQCGQCGAANPLGTRFCGQCGAPATPASAPRPPAAVEERRLVTAVFADLSGFTALATRLDPEELQDVIDPVLLVLSRVIEGHGGQVEKYAGDAVLALFGVPVQYEDDALRAMRTAHDLHAALASVLPGLPPAARRLTLHVGVDSGHVVARLLGKELRLDYGVLGDCVVRAQRLESVTPAGETYVGESTWRLVRDHVALTDLGTRELKGFSAPVRAWRATAGVAAVTEGRLYGRQAELARAQEVLGAVRGPASSALLISGEAGAGKSRLIHELRTLAARQHLRWVQVAASSFGGSEPYALLVQVLRLVRPVVGGASDVLDVVAEGGLPPPGTDPEAFRIEVHAAVVGVLRQWATEPSVLVIEDLHWADASSSEALAAGLSALADLPVMVLASSRRADEPLLQVLGHPVRIELAALSDDSVGALVREMLDGTCPQAHVEDGVLAFVGQRSGGNPFFLRELVRALQEQGLLRLVDGRWAMDEAAAGAIPDTVDGVVAARLDALPGPARRVLQTCAVIGVEVQEALLRTLEPEMAEALAVLSTAGLLAPRGGGGWVFRHALLQEVAYSRLLRRSRKAIHQRVAEAILQVNGDADEVMDALARHLAQGARGPAALTASWRAATRAAGLFAHTEALSQLEVTLELAGENPDHEPGQSAVRSVMGDLLELLGRYEQAQAHYEAVVAAVPDVRAWRGLAAALRKRGRHAEALEALARGRAAAGAQAALALEEGRVHLDAGNLDAAVEAFHAALDRPGDGLDRAVAHVHLARALALQGRLEAARAAGELGRSQCLQEHDDRGLALANRVLGGVLLDLGRHADAAALLREGVELAERLGHAEEVGGGLVNLGRAQLALGQLPAALESDRQALALFTRIGHVPGRVTAAANLAEKLGQAGQVEEALEMCSQAELAAEQIGDRLALADLARTRAQLRLAGGDWEQAAAGAEAAAELFLHAGAEGEAAETLLLAARACRTGEQTSRAAELTARAATLLA